MTIKKAELHVHLEGTIWPDLALKLAKRNGLQLPEGLIAADKQSYLYKDFLDFLNAYDKVAEVIKAPEDYYDITYDYLRRSAEEGVIYTEMMYSPDHAEQASGIASSEHLAAIQRAIDTAEAKHQIKGRIIITAVRHFGVESAIKVATEALKETAPCIVGFGLGGDEIHFPPKLFEKAYAIAHEGGLACTVHAGEFADASGMMEAMDYLPIRRIGHGVKGIHSQEVIARLKDKNIALEICPSSNIALGLYPSLVEHPLNQFMQEGVQFCLNSDDPPFFRTSIGEEYQRVQAFYNYSDAIMQQFTEMAIEHAFVDDSIKSELRLQLRQ